MVCVGTIDNVFIARQSHDCGKTLSRQPLDSDTTKNRRAKKVHVQFSSHHTRQRHYAQNIVQLSYDDHKGPTILPIFMSLHCIDVSWVRCYQGLINLALHGTVAQETTYTNASNSYNATLAIEGPANNNWRDGCSSTGWQLKTWWGLFLPGLVYITNVKSYHREDEAQRMNEFRLYLANGSVYKTTELCFIDSAKQAYRNLNQSIDCHLSPTRNIYFFNRRTYVELCYIEIYGNVLT
ncbi:Hypothetical predicted protein [Mytilus galloprovincialis]|uniref:Fucolectin tachylectin-4 pentraxin-1 domain-containing protein n=1 Tax=Mytilus galloprovincialis TaxID=29158 RepID=A0A8B6GLU2_MYTGA|nr:Hypothetical predicted protein [Mytilus galloprovincialis]